MFNMGGRLLYFIRRGPYTAALLGAKSAIR